MKPTGRRASFVLPALLVAGAASLGLALGLLAGGAPALAGTDHPEHARAAVPARQVAFRQDMRVLWEDHVTWTRMAIVDFAAGSPSLPASQARLLRNQTDIGNAIAPFYGETAGRRLTALLREHILIAVDVLVAAKAGDAQALSAAQARWVRNADGIAGFLSTANPDAWPRAEMRSMMRHHLKLTTDEAVARLTGDWRGDVRAYGRVHIQALHMADMLSAGIIDQFPRRFR
jgi:hypothetical protein